jgi:hypothetical protein
MELMAGSAGEMQTSTSLTPFFLDFAFKAKGEEREKEENG